jgi:hypothetical protein
MLCPSDFPAPCAGKSIVPPPLRLRNPVKPPNLPKTSQPQQNKTNIFLAKVAF